MKISTLCIMILFSCLLLTKIEAQQVINGQIKNTAGQELAYVNIGIVGTSTGTVSDEGGKFSLYLSESNTPRDTLRVSMIGYKSESFSLAEVSDSLFIQLEDDVFILEEIVVKPQFVNAKTVGRKKVSGNMNVNFALAKKPRQNLGAEIGKQFKVKGKKTTKVESLRFYIRANDYEMAKFRLLFYTVKKGKPSKYLSDKDIIITIKNKQSGWIEVDLRDYDIITNKTFIASLQWIDASEEGRNLAMPIDLPVLGSHHYYKFGSQAKWKHFRNMSAAMNVTLAY